MGFIKKRELTGVKCIQRVLSLKAIILVIIFAVILVLSAFFLTNYFNKEKKVTVTIDQGTLVGEELLDYGNETFYAFKGIPYAKPPIGELRFKAPEPAEPWSGIYDATKLRPYCPQVRVSLFNFSNAWEQSEDCLFLNVYTKKSSELKPVMVHIFGGSFECGSIFDERYGPQFLMTEGIVLVRISYRLNVFGFSAIDDPKYGIHGNMGFKDQVLALKWIQNNIQHFGGDPKQVTIFGESSGAISAHLLCLSPLASGLIHRAILQGGTAGITSKIYSPIKFKNLDQTLNCSSDNLDDFVNCINQTTTKNLINGMKALENRPYYNKILNFQRFFNYNVLTIENNSTSDSFLVDTPDKILEKGKFEPVPMIIGLNRDEGSAFAWQSYVTPNFTDNRLLIPPEIMDNIDLESEKAMILGNMIKELYYGNQTPSYEYVEPYMNHLADTIINSKILKDAKLHSKRSNTVPVYFYLYNETHAKHAFEIRDLFYVKGITPDHMDENSDAYRRMRFMTSVWTAFAKTADPNSVNDRILPVKWLPVQPNQFNYLIIQPRLELDQNPFEKRMKFWEKVYAEFHKDVY